nr:MAG TPA: hypothetical protein [Caudoviricetes sp.]
MKIIALECKYRNETDNLYKALSEKVELYRRKGYPYVHDSGAMYDALTEQDHEIIRICGRLDALEEMLIESVADHSVFAYRSPWEDKFDYLCEEAPNEE